MSVKGGSYARFQRSLAMPTPNPNIVLAAAAELDRLSLEDALSVLLVLRGDDRYGKAGARWLALLIGKTPTLTLPEVALAAAALGVLAEASSAPGAAALGELLDAHGHDRAARRLDDLRD